MREKMSANSRARQFLPFDAMTGLQEALRAAEFENESVLHHRLSEDEARRIGDVLKELREKRNVHLRYFKNDHFFERDGEAKLDAYRSVLLIDNEEIPIFDIRDLSIKD